MPASCSRPRCRASGRTLRPARTTSSGRWWLESGVADDAVESEAGAELGDPIAADAAVGAVPAVGPDHRAEEAVGQHPGVHRGIGQAFVLGFADQAVDE